MDGRDGFLDGVFGGASTTFLVVAALVALGFLALPTWYVLSEPRARARRRTWTVTTARLLSSRTVVRRLAEHQRVVVLGRWSYLDDHGTEHTREGDLRTTPIREDDDGTRTVQVLVDPADPRRSQLLFDPPSTSARVVTALTLWGMSVAGATLLLFSAGPLLTR